MRAIAKLILELGKALIKVIVSRSEFFIKMNNFYREAIIFVILPLILVSTYLFFLSTDRFQSEASVLVEESGVAQIESGFLDGLGLTSGNSTSDEQLLRSYLHSPGLLLLLEEKFSLKNHYSQSLDFLFGLSNSDSFEDFLEFFREQVSVAPDSETGLLTIQVHTYSPMLSKSLADEILSQGEKFINESSQAIANSEMQFALDEIDLSQERLKKAKSFLIQFQNQYGLVSPESDGDSLFKIIFSLEGELAATEAALHQAQSYLNPDTPQVAVLMSKSEALRKQIALQKLRITGEAAGDDKLNELSAKYQELVLDVELATALYKSALSAYEVARVQAAKQLKYLVVASRPHLAEEALYPQRFYWFFTWTIIFLISWGIFRLIMASNREHKD